MRLVQKLQVMRKKEVKLPPIKRYVPAEFEAELNDASDTVQSTLVRMNKFDPRSKTETTAQVKQVETMDDVERREMRKRLWKYKYTRIIEQHLPPLPSIDELRQQVADREEAVKEYVQGAPKLPAVRMDTLPPMIDPATRQQRKLEAKRRVDSEYEKKRLETQKTTELKQARMEQHRIEKAAGRRTDPREVAAILSHNWLTLVFAIASLKTMKDLDTCNKISTKDLADIVKTTDKKSWGKQSDTSVLFRRGMEIVQLETSSEVQAQLPYIQQRFAGRVKVLRRRKNAQIIMETMSRWCSAGRVVKSLRVFHYSMRKIQKYCREKMKECRKKLNDAIDRWDIMEKEIAKSVVQSNKRLSMKEIERESKQAAKKSKGGRRQTVNIGLSDADLVSLNVTPSDVQRAFLKHELRVMRYKWLTDFASWETRMEHYREEVAGWREQHAACDAMGKEWNTFKYPAPEIPPVPVATPTDEQLLEMIHRCRADPDDLTPVPVSRFPQKKKPDEEDKDQTLSKLDQSPSKSPSKRSPVKGLAGQMPQKAEATDAGTLPSARDYLPHVPQDEFF